MLLVKPHTIKKQKNFIRDRIIEEGNGTTLSHFVC